MMMISITMFSKWRNMKSCLRLECCVAGILFFLEMYRFAWQKSGSFYCQAIILMLCNAGKLARKSNKSMSSRVINYLSESSSVPTKVSDDPAVFAMIMSEFRHYEQLKVGT